MEELLNQIDVMRRKEEETLMAISKQKESIQELKRQLARCENGHQQQLFEIEQQNTILLHKRKAHQKQYDQALIHLQAKKDSYNEIYAQCQAEILEKADYLKQCQQRVAILEQQKNELKADQIQQNAHTTSKLDDYDHQKNHLSDAVEKKESLHVLLQTQIIKNQEVHMKIETVQNEMQMLTDKCENTNVAIKETEEIIQDLEVHVALLKHEKCAMKKGSQLTHDKANSLFDEVNDGRVSAQLNVIQLNEKYTEMKKRRNALTNHVNYLKLQHTNLKTKSDELKQDSHFDTYVIECSYTEFRVLVEFLFKSLGWLKEMNDLIKYDQIMLRESNIFFKVLDKLSSKIQNCETKLSAGKFTNSTYIYQVSEQKLECKNVTQRIKEKQKINQELLKCIGKIEQKEGGGDSVCICTL